MKFLFTNGWEKYRNYHFFSEKFRSLIDDNFQNFYQQIILNHLGCIMMHQFEFPIPTAWGLTFNKKPKTSEKIKLHFIDQKTVFDINNCSGTELSFLSQLSSWFSDWSQETIPKRKSGLYFFQFKKISSRVKWFYITNINLRCKKIQNFKQLLKILYNEVLSKNEHQIAEDVLILCVQDYATDKLNLSFNVPHE